MSGSAAAIVENDELIREAMKASPERVDLLVTGTRVDRHPVERIVREKDDMGATITRVEPVYDEETGQPKFTEVEIVTYDVIRDGIKCGGECRLDQVLSVNTSLPSDDYAANIAKRRAVEIISQLERMRSGEESALPDGHLPLAKWGGVSDHVIAVLKANRIYSVQQVRDLSEAQVARLPGGVHANRLRDEARAFLLRKQDEIAADASARQDKEIAAVRKENAELRGMLEKLLTKLGVDDDEDEAPEPGSDEPAKSSEEQDAAALVAASEVEAAREEANAQRHERANRRNR